MNVLNEDSAERPQIIHAVMDRSRPRGSELTILLVTSGAMQTKDYTISDDVTRH